MDIITGLILLFLFLILGGAACFAQGATGAMNFITDYYWIGLLIMIIACFIFSYAHEYETKIQRGVFGTLFGITSSFKVILGIGVMLPSIYAFLEADTLGKIVGLLVIAAVFFIAFIFSIVPVLVIKFIRWHIDENSWDYTTLKLSLTYALDLLLSAICYMVSRWFCIALYEDFFITSMAGTIYPYLLLIN